MRRWMYSVVFAAAFLMIGSLSFLTTGCSTVGTAAEGTGDVAGQAIEDTGRAAGRAVEGTGDVIKNTAEKAEDEMD